MAIFFQRNKQNEQMLLKRNRLFAKKKYSSLWFVLSVLLSFSLMVVDCRDRSLPWLRNIFTGMMVPVQFAVDYPVQVVAWSRSLIGSKKALVDENMRLRYQQTVLEARLQKFLALRNENSELKSLLSASSSAQMRSMAARILAVDTSTSRQIVVISKGSHDGVIRGQAVLDAKGVTGQVIDVGLLTSTVLLISDSKCAVPVLNQRTGERAIVVGTNHIGRLALVNLPKTSSVAVGDLLVTSGLGGNYPEGYPVGYVEEVQNTSGDDFIKVMVNPLAWLNRSRLVLLVWPEEKHNELSTELTERLLALEGVG
ncbi:MAG: rod shape-determining protein MreC [Legionellales bacterium]|nr:rod shape-determining protein MreC [Legionellales bacterium]